MNFEYYLDLHQKGNLSEAEKGYRKLLKKEKNNSVLLTSLGLVCLKTDKDEEPSLDLVLNVLSGLPLYYILALIGKALVKEQKNN